MAQQLGPWGIVVHRGIAGTGLVGVLRNGSSGRAIGRDDAAGPRASSSAAIENGMR